MSSDHRIVTAKIWLSLRKNATRTATTKHYDWALLTTEIWDKYVVELRNRFETLQEKTEKGTPNDEYENFVDAHLEVAAKYIPTKPRTKYRIPWEMLAVREKRGHVKTASKSYRKNPTNTNARKAGPARTYIQQLCEDTGCSPEDLPEAMNDREKWRERVRNTYASGTTWWWWWWCVEYYFCISGQIIIICIFGPILLKLCNRKI